MVDCNVAVESIYLALLISDIPIGNILSFCPWSIQIREELIRRMPPLFGHSLCASVVKLGVFLVFLLCSVVSSTEIPYPSSLPNRAVRLHKSRRLLESSSLDRTKTFYQPILNYRCGVSPLQVGATGSISNIAIYSLVQRLKFPLLEAAYECRFTEWLHPCQTHGDLMTCSLWLARPTGTSRRIPAKANAQACQLVGRGPSPSLNGGVSCSQGVIGCSGTSLMNQVGSACPTLTQ